MTPLRTPPTERDIKELLTFGVVNLDKPAGPTSHQVSTWVCGLTGVDRSGHAGTLDPEVTGCLPVLLGDATRTATALTAGDKVYVAILELHDEPPEGWRVIIDRFTGEIYQRPPRKSAVSRSLRTRTIHSIDVLERDGRRVLIEVSCEAGTYIRKLCHDIGLAIGTGGHMASLRRIESQPFDDRSLVTLHDLADALAFWEDDGDETALKAIIRPAEEAIAHLPSVTVAADAATEIAHGAPVYAPGVLDIDEQIEAGELVACVTPAGVAVCLGHYVGEPGQTHGVMVELERVLL